MLPGLIFQCLVLLWETKYILCSYQRTQKPKELQLPLQLSRHSIRKCFRHVNTKASHISWDNITRHIDKAAHMVCHLHNNPSSDNILSQMKPDGSSIAPSTTTDDARAVNGLI